MKLTQSRLAGAVEKFFDFVAFSNRKRFSITSLFPNEQLKSLKHKNRRIIGKRIRKPKTRTAAV